MPLISKETLWILFIVCGMLLTGTINTIVKKVQNGWVAPGIIGRPHKVRLRMFLPTFPPIPALPSNALHSISIHTV